MSVSKNTTKRMLWRIIHTLESKSKEEGAEMIVLYLSAFEKEANHDTRKATTD